MYVYVEEQKPLEPYSMFTLHMYVNLLVFDLCQTCQRKSRPSQVIRKKELQKSNQNSYQNSMYDDNRKPVGADETSCKEGNIYMKVNGFIVSRRGISSGPVLTSEVKFILHSVLLNDSLPTLHSMV